MRGVLHSIVEDLGFVDDSFSWRGQPTLSKDGDWIERRDSREVEEFLAPRAAFADFLLERGIS